MEGGTADPYRLYACFVEQLRSVGIASIFSAILRESRMTRFLGDQDRSSKFCCGEQIILFKCPMVNAVH